MEIQKISAYSSHRRELTTLVDEIVESPTKDILERIEKGYSGDTEIALLKLFYHCVDDMNVRTALLEKYGDAVMENNYIVLWSNKSVKNTDEYFFEADSETETEYSDDSISFDKPCSYYDDALKDISVEEYEERIARGERKRISDLYSSLGSDICDNLEYRKELLTKLAYIAKEQNDAASYNDSIIKLGVVLYYSYASINSEKSRAILFETVTNVKKDSKRNAVEAIKEAVCNNLASYKDVNEIVDDKNEIINSINHMLIINTAKEYSVFFKKMIENVDMISEVLDIADISQRSSNYQKVSSVFKTLVARNSGSPVFGPVYTKWYRLVQAEIKKLSKGAVLNLEIETIQCSARGKICCALQNVGKKPAENISIRAIFEDTIRCKDNEKEIKILYGGDTSVFAFNIRCKDEGFQKYKIELSYDIGSNTEQLDYSQDIRIVRETEYEHIGNIYSVAPVTSNAEFYGREREKEEILSFLNDTKYNTSMVMHGLKRVGKTSMLRFIERTMRDSDIYIPVYKSAQGIGEKNAIGKMFVETIIDEIENTGIVDDKCRSYLEYNYDTNPEQLYDFYTYLQKEVLPSNIIYGG